ncbi:uncharacterized protein N7483_003574 [Penicillium malachiteum]|uniref:uncharacterized protein n=1 Tax=Penicillium malachiteum TaxID=1324776 RepID=UPI002546758C|nr:uncharacterized protein N7483_003574 [Penicillium malachiteum]KAJ5729066.1 hypothetical protein N7483_003574 [Penicillium malachiteum]
MNELTTPPDPAPSADPRPDQPKLSLSHESHQDQKQNSYNLPQPKLRIHVEELRHSASSAFFLLIPNVTEVFDNALGNILRYLYTSPNLHSSELPRKPFFDPSVPPTRSVTLLLRDIAGVAYTTGTELDDDHKEIHLSLQYVEHCVSKGQAAKADPLHELVGVITHELVHCYQHTTPPQAVEQDKKIPRPPGGLIEGIADFVRLKAGLGPPHWKRPKSASERAKKWDAGYQNTAFFLAWIEDVWASEGAIGMLNDRLLRTGYVGEDTAKGEGESGFWASLFGVGVAHLWDEYGKWLDQHGEHDEKV